MIHSEKLSTTAPTIRIGDRIRELAARHPERTAVIVPDAVGTPALTWGELDRTSDAAAGRLAAAGVGPGVLVAVRLPMGLDHVVATLAAWKLSATVLPLDPESTEREFAVLLDTAHPAVVVATAAHDAVTTVPAAELWTAPLVDPAAFPAGTPRSAHATGGSTGRPRIILRRPDWVYPAEDFPSTGDRAVGLDVGQVQLAMIPLHHAGFTKLYHGLALGHTVVLVPQVVPARIPELIERHRVNYFIIVPSLMRRLLAVPALREVDVSSVTTVHQSSAGAPPELKRAWMEVFPPETLYEGYSSQERIGALWIRGDEWLRHPGSVGRPVDCEVRVYREDGGVAAAGEVGEVFLRSRFTRQPSYLGDGPALPERDGFMSLGDAGFLDEEGYLHIVGRRAEMINVGGVKVYPAEVEEVLRQHPGVADVAVAARPHAVLGQAVHAVVVPAVADAPPAKADLRRHCQLLLSTAKMPLTYEFRETIPHTDTGKLRRSTLVGSPAATSG
jgi:bile acid-coenzyme A ligase